jgi:hemerythrin-like domain-containing protein
MSPSIARTLATIHKVITRGLEVTSSRSQSFAEAGFDPSLRAGFISYARTFVNLTHAHHDTEDVLIFPYGQEKMPDTAFDLLVSQHREIAVLLDEMGAAIDEAEKNPAATEPLSRISRLGAQISEIWQPHIREEEIIFSPERVTAVATPEEQGSLMQQAAQHGMSHAGPDYLAAPFVLHNLEPEDRAYMAGEMPPVVSQELVPVVWKDQWAPMKPFLLP